MLVDLHSHNALSLRQVCQEQPCSLPRVALSWAKIGEPMADEIDKEIAHSSKVCATEIMKIVRGTKDAVWESRAKRVKARLKHGIRPAPLSSSLCTARNTRGTHTHSFSSHPKKSIRGVDLDVRRFRAPVNRRLRHSETPSGWRCGPKTAKVRHLLVPTFLCCTSHQKKGFLQTNIKPLHTMHARIPPNRALLSASSKDLIHLWGAGPLVAHTPLHSGSPLQAWHCNYSLGWTYWALFSCISTPLTRWEGGLSLRISWGRHWKSG